ncbi:MULTISPECIES: esterase/lipase family protein [Nocardioides]|uniref:Esterase/lipase family protein n=1 Tax=Nocardioides vastitatis TaxID=2568655 RepID=A0ABW0ZAZ7_9ACTN|nr:alpha/beta hydrolase [Nocardioides sp.]THI95951.1 alpha/beta hydrolase [Nocardioides sp.]
MKQEPTVIEALALLAAVADDLVVTTARETHTAVVDRAYGVVRKGLGPAGGSTEAIHRGIATAVYGALGLTLRGASLGLDRLAETGVGPRLEDRPRGRFVSAAVNGLIGEELRRERPRLAIETGVRHQGRDVVLTEEGVGAAFPDATAQVVVFLHGLCENEDYWKLHRQSTGSTYGESLARRGWTPVYLRANTGLGVRENGVAMSALLQRLVGVWPTEVRRIALVGHSLGGLISRTALAVKADQPGDRGWTDLVTDVVTLGTPHLGAPLAKSAHHGSRLLNRMPESRGFGAILDRRSLGIRDLREGVAAEVPALPHVRFRLVSATLTRSPRHPVAQVVGDLLVTPRSAVGRDRRGTDLFPGAETLHVGRTDHFGLLNHPEVHAALARWLG